MMEDTVSASTFPLEKTRSPEPGTDSESAEAKMELDRLTIRYRKQAAISDVTMPAYRNRITAVIGPSGCGKSTLLRALNRMNDPIPGVTTDGQVRVDGVNIYDSATDVIELRRRVGMVFQSPNPFPKTVYDNVAFGMRINRLARSRAEMDRRVEAALTSAALWNEVKDRLGKSALQLSGGQQQRLCIARALAVEPEVLLMDEPASALDPVATAKLEELMADLKRDYTIVVVTHNMQQAARVSDFTAFLLSGSLVEFSPTANLFTKPDDPRTEAYITGRFG